MPLSDIKCRQAASKAKTYRLFDAGGMYLEVSPKGSKYFRLKYRFQAREKRLALGVYPECNLKTARQKREEARHLLSQGIDPSAAKQAAKKAAVDAADAEEAPTPSEPSSEEAA